MVAAADIANRSEQLAAEYVGLQMALSILIDPRMPLIDALARYDMSPDAPVAVSRHDGTTHSDNSVRTWVTRLAGAQGEPVISLMSVAALSGAATLWDMIDAAGLRDSSSPLLEFARHYRNACAHGDRWHFVGNEPRTAAELRGRPLHAGLHGSKAT